jgi:archaeosortase A (PGF-CTERM-specific)
MSDIPILAAFLAFLVFLVAGRRKKYVAIAGWTILVLSLLTEVPEYLSLDNLLYPLIAVLSVPFLAITIHNLLRDEPITLQLSNAAAIATLIYVPFTFIPVLRDLLIGTVVNETVWLLHVLGHHAQLEGWNIIIRNGFATEIILACTGITAIAIMLGVTAGSEKLSLRHGILALLIVVPTIYVLNILRVVVVFIAWSDQWFSFLPDPSGGTSGFGTGYASFFWAHNVFAEMLSLFVLVAIAYALFRVVPGLAEFARDLIGLYLHEVRTIAGRLRAISGIPK